MSFSYIGTFVFMREFFFSYLTRLAKSKLHGYTWHLPIMHWGLFYQANSGDFWSWIPCFHSWHLTTEPPQKSWICISIGFALLAFFFLCPTIICSRPASWDSHFINRNRCLEKLHSFVAKRKDPQPDSFVNPSLYFCAYIALCLLLSALPNVLQFLFQYNYRNVPLISQGSYRHDMSWNNYKTENST